MPRMLGKLEHVPSKRDFLFKKLVDTKAVLPTLPRTFGHEKGFALKMFGNGPDETVVPGFLGAGDCVFAGACEEIHLHEHAAKRTMAPLSGREAIRAYEAVTGYQIGNPSSDRGTVVRDALSWRRKTGLKDAQGKAHKIGAFLSIEPGNFEHVLVALRIFGAVGIGFEFPKSAWTQLDHGEPWSVVPGSTTDGGHYVPVVARRNQQSVDVLTWAQVQRMNEDFFAKYCDEAWAIVPTEYTNPKTKKTPEGFDAPSLNRMLAAL